MFLYDFDESVSSREERRTGITMAIRGSQNLLTSISHKLIDAFK
jgi:hypothetical protein